ncbi:MAG: polysaccharide biosynthesis C-terminal domain-containing protein, partial [Candidatus Omnitrophota bacterium]
LAFSSVLISLGVSLFAHKIVSILYGADFASVGLLLQWHIWALPFAALGIANTYIVIAEGRPRDNFIRTAAAGVFSVLMNVFFLSIWGLHGAVIVSVSAYFLATFVIGFLPGMHQQAMMMGKSFFDVLCWREFWPRGRK